MRSRITPGAIAAHPCNYGVHLGHPSFTRISARTPLTSGTFSSPRTIDDSRVDVVITKTLESVPAGATHWSTRTMAREMDIFQTAVSRIWRAFGLQPHREETFKLSSDPLFSPEIHILLPCRR